MAWTQVDLDALEAAIKKGLRSVQYPNGSIVYQSLTEMLKLRDAMQQVVAVAAGNTTRCTYGSFSKG